MSANPIKRVHLAHNTAGRPYRRGPSTFTPTYATASLTASGKRPNNGPSTQAISSVLVRGRKADADLLVPEMTAAMNIRLGT